jgi:hypothetical protein
MSARGAEKLRHSSLEQDRELSKKDTGTTTRYLDRHRY